MEIVDRLYLACPAVPIVILSAACDQAVAEEALLKGAQDFILKERVDDYVLPKTLAAVLDRAEVADALYNERERAQITLNSIGDAVVCTDVEGNVSYLNIVAERLNGWPRAEALGRPFEIVLRIIDSATGARILNPMKAAALHEPLSRCRAHASWSGATAKSSPSRIPRHRFTIQAAPSSGP